MAVGDLALAADGARAVLAQPRVNASGVERVVAAGELAQEIAVFVIAQADCALPAKKRSPLSV